MRLSPEVEASRRRIVAERALERVQDYPAELQPHIIQAIGARIAEDTYQDVLENDPVVQDEVNTLLSLESHLEGELHAHAHHPNRDVDLEGAPGSSWLEDRGPDLGEVGEHLDALDDIRDFHEYARDVHDWLGEFTDVPVPLFDEFLTQHSLGEEILAPVATSDNGLILKTLVQFEGEYDLGESFVLEHRYARAVHRLLSALREDGTLEGDPEQIAEHLRELSADGGLPSRKLRKLVSLGWFYYDDELGVLTTRIEESQAEDLLSDLAIAWPEQFLTYARSI